MTLTVYIDVWSFIIQYPCQSEVEQSNRAILVYANVITANVRVNYFLGVNVLDGLTYLIGVFLDDSFFELSLDLFRSEEIVERVSDRAVAQV